MSMWQPNYITRTELEAYVRVSDGLDEPQFDTAIAAASRVVDDWCRRQFGQVPTAQARIYSARVDQYGRYVVDLEDLQDTTGMAVATDTQGDGGFITTVTNYQLGPRNALADGLPFNQLASYAALPVLPDRVRVTAKWGWASIPDAVKQATLIQASRILMRRESPFGISGSPDAGGELRLLSKVDADVEVILRPFKRRWWAV